MTNPSPRRSVSVVRKLTLVLLFAVGFGVADAAAVGAASPAQVGNANQLAAVTAADEMLGELVLPAGATEVPAEPVGDAYLLAHPDELFFYAAEVERHQFWTTSASPRAVIASIDAHLPAGAHSSGPANAATAVRVVHAADRRGARPRPPDLDVKAVELTGGGTGVRADAAVRYSAPRIPDQRIPPRARLLEITRAGMGESPPPFIADDRSKVGRVAGPWTACRSPRFVGSRSRAPSSCRPRSSPSPSAPRRTALSWPR